MSYFMTYVLGHNKSLSFDEILYTKFRNYYLLYEPILISEVISFGKMSVAATQAPKGSRLGGSVG